MTQKKTKNKECYYDLYVGLLRLVRLYVFVCIKEIYMQSRNHSVVRRTKTSTCIHSMPRPNMRVHLCAIYLLCIILYYVCDKVREMIWKIHYRFNITFTENYFIPIWMICGTRQPTNFGACADKFQNTQRMYDFSSMKHLWNNRANVLHTNYRMGLCRFYWLVRCYIGYHCLIAYRKRTHSD